MKKLYSESTYDVYETETGDIIAKCTDSECNCMGQWTMQQATVEQIEGKV